MQKKLYKAISSLFGAARVKTGVYLTVVNGKIIITHTNGNLAITPSLARQLAEELPAMAVIAERGFQSAEETPS